MDLNTVLISKCTFGWFDGLMHDFWFSDVLFSWRISLPACYSNTDSNNNNLYWRWRLYQYNTNSILSSDKLFYIIYIIYIFFPVLEKKQICKIKKHPVPYFYKEKNTLRNFIASLKKGFGIDFFFLVLIFKLNTMGPIKLWNRKTTVIILIDTNNMKYRSCSACRAGHVLHFEIICAFISWLVPPGGRGGQIID